jgi:DNA-directed RNA polymerase specialized sigma24 family protein
MVEWQAVVLALQIFLLAISWALFQKARAELSARAAETPVLSEVRALQRNVKQLLQELTTTGAKTAEQLEAQCADARELLLELDSRLEVLTDTTLALREAGQTLPGLAAVESGPEPFSSSKPPLASAQAVTLTLGESKRDGSAPLTKRTQRQVVYTLADAGANASEIARETGLSEGEVETLLGLRAQRAAQIPA